MSSQNIPPEFTAIFETMMEKLVDEALRNNRPPSGLNPEYIYPVSVAATQMGIRPADFVEYLMQNGVKTAYTFFLGKLALQVYGLPLPNMPGLGLHAPMLSNSKGLDAIVFMKQGDVFETQKLTFKDLSMLETENHTRIALRPPQLETLESCVWKPDFKFIGAKIEPHAYNSNCILAHLPTGTSREQHNFYSTMTALHIYNESSRKEKDDEK